MRPWLRAVLPSGCPSRCGCGRVPCVRRPGRRGGGRWRCASVGRRILDECKGLRASPQRADPGATGERDPFTRPPYPRPNLPGRYGRRWSVGQALHLHFPAGSGTSFLRRPTHGAQPRQRLPLKINIGQLRRQCTPGLSGRGSYKARREHNGPMPGPHDRRPRH
jgi:hypothetical protein